MLNIPAVIYILTGLIISSTPALAQESCRDLFIKPDPSGLTLSVPSDPLLLSDYFEQLRLQYEKNPEKLPVISHQLLEMARTLLREGRVEYSETVVFDQVMILIHPSDATPINRFAKLMEATYEARVAISPHILLTSRVDAFVYTLNYERRETPEDIIGIGWNHITQLDTLQPLRDPTLLHEMRHLRYGVNLIKRIPSPFYGEMTTERSLPGDIYAHEPAYARYMSFSEMKTFHTQAKEEITLVRGLLRRSQNTDAIHAQIENIMYTLQLFEIVSWRTNHTLETLFGEIQRGGGDFTEQSIHSVPTAVFDSPTGFEVRIPIVQAQMLADFQNNVFLEKQLMWTHETSVRALAQARAANEQILAISQMRSRRAIIEALDRLQATLSTTALESPSPY